MKEKSKLFTVILISTFRGYSLDATHYYGRLMRIGDTHVTLTRPITKEDIEKYPDRFYAYKEGEEISAFNTWRDVIDAGAKVAEKKGIDLNEVYVEGIPNTGVIPYYEAIKPLDTRLKCCKCGKVIKRGEGVYNTPDGVFCVKCYEDK